MSQHNAVTSLFVDRKISTKVVLGFVCVLAILVVLSGMSYSAFKSSAGGFATYAQRVAVVGIARDIDRGFINLRRFVREYAFTGVAANVDAAKQEQASLHGLLVQGLDLIKNPERHQRLEDSARSIDAYEKDFDLVVTQTRNLTKLEGTQLDPLGATQLRNFEALVAATTKAGDTSVAVPANEALKHFMLARLGVNKLLGRHEASAGADAEKSFVDLAAVMQGLDASTKGVEYRAIFDALQAGIVSYRDIFHQANTLEVATNSLVNGAMADLAKQVQAGTEAIKVSGIAEEQQEEHSTLATMNWASTMILGLSIGGALLGVALAWVIGRGIAGPVVQICTAMRALAGGDKTTDIPGLGRKDEVGQMADTVKIFKDNMIEADRVRGEHEQHKIETEAARKAAMLRLADTFEASIKGVVQSVAAQATEMQASATTLASAAEQATHQATTVAAAVEQASANVQTVASSAEELTSSVLEIGRQMEQSSKIAHQAVSEADRTNTVVEGLSKTAQRIGEVVQLIQMIANQTNLLALNATIEAARAGDAGKGFAVVASEVKSLANQTAKATSDIKTQIDDIQATTGHTVEAIRTIGGIIREMNEIATAIASAVEEQGAATREIAANVHQAAQGTSAIASNIEGVSRAAGDTGAAATQLLGVAGGLSKQADTLSNDVDSFLATVRAA